MAGVEPYAKLLLYNLGNDLGSPYAGIQTAGDRPALDDIPQLNFCNISISIGELQFSAMQYKAL